MKKILIIICSLFLFACGDGGGIFGPEPNMHFKVGSREYEYYFPEEWQNVPAEENSDAVALGRKGSENFTILSQSGSSQSLITDIWENASNDFLFFEPVFQSDNQWAFQAKIDETTPIREYHQKVLQIPGYDYFLMASCSFEIQKTENSDCENIVRSFRPVPQEEE